MRFFSRFSVFCLGLFEGLLVSRALTSSATTFSSHFFFILLFPVSSFFSLNVLLIYLFPSFFFSNHFSFLLFSLFLSRKLSPNSVLLSFVFHISFFILFFLSFSSFFQTIVSFILILFLNLSSPSTLKRNSFDFIFQLASDLHYFTSLADVPI